MNKFSEKDWKIFRSKIAGWQEAYMDSKRIVLGREQKWKQKSNGLKNW